MPDALSLCSSIPFILAVCFLNPYVRVVFLLLKCYFHFQTDRKRNVCQRSFLTILFYFGKIFSNFSFSAIKMKKHQLTANNISLLALLTTYRKYNPKFLLSHLLLYWLSDSLILTLPSVFQFF